MSIEVRLLEDIKLFILKNKLGQIDENCSFKELTTLKTGGNIAMVFFPNTIANFIKFYRYTTKLKVNEDIIVIGGGSNIFASDKTYHGIIVSFKQLDVKLSRFGNRVTTYPHLYLSSLISKMHKKGYTGGEALLGIPGTVGGAIYMNAGAYGDEIANYLIKCLCINKEGKIKWYQKKELQFSYRSSLIQKESLIILVAVLEFKSNCCILQNNICNDYRMLRREAQPLTSFSAGSTFKNPPNNKAWRLIDGCGLRGKELNGAKVSNKHCNFIINRGDATSQDIYTLVKTIQEEVYYKYGIKLELEWVLINFAG